MGRATVLVFLAVIALAQVPVPGPVAGGGGGGSGGGAGSVPSTISAASPVTVAATSNNYWCNVAGGCTFNLPTANAATPQQFCFYQYTSRSAVMTIVAPAATFIVLNGANSSSAGNIQSTGTLADAACVTAIDATHYGASASPGFALN